MAIKPTGSNISLSTTPSTLSNAVCFFAPTGSQSLISITDSSNNTLYSIVLPSALYTQQFLIRKTPNQYVTSNISFTVTPCVPIGTGNLPVLKLLSISEEVNATSYSTINNATRVALTMSPGATNGILINFLDGSNNQYSSMVVPSNNMIIVIKNPTDIITSNAVVYATKVGINY